jgi:sialate O-acetylesterase
MNNLKRTYLLLFFLVVGISNISAKIKLPAIVGDNMVLQQQSNVKIWGWSTPNATVKVDASWGQKKTTKADTLGKWEATILTPAASFTSNNITISDGEVVTIGNVLIGEVWLVSGQSNMEMPFTGFGAGIPDANQTIAEGGMYPHIRLFTVQKKSSIVPQEDCSGTWNISSPSAVKSFSAIGYYYAMQLRKILNVPVGIINSSWGGTAIEAWMDAESQKTFTDLDLKLLYDEKYPVFNKPISLYNAMIAPIVNYSIRGTLWYQGESNVPRYATYGDKMVAMINLWRARWNNDKMPFYYVEIAPYNYLENKLDLTDAQINAAVLREQQGNVMKRLSNVGMVSQNDLVSPSDINEIHPTNKLAVAKRLSYWALSETYGFGDAVTVIGPQYKSMAIDGNKVTLKFEDKDGKDVSARIQGEEAIGFEIAGKDKIFYPANAVIVGPPWRPIGMAITSDKVSEPVAVRYCFKNFLLGNVTGAYGFPLVPFRTDDW